MQDVSSRDAGLLEEWAIELTTVSSHTGAPAPSAVPAIALSDRESRALARCSSLERDLRNRRIEAACGAGLWSALEVDVKGGRLQRERVRLGTYLARELGLRFGHSIHFALDEHLADLGFRIVVNGLVRSTGELQPGRYGQPRDGAAPTDDLFVGPLSGLTYARLPDDTPGGFDVPDRLIRHIRAAVREAAPEFADADWATAFLDRVGHTYPVTVPAVRTAAGNDLLAAVLRELVTQGVSVADPRLLELIPSLVRSPDLAAECMALALAPPRHLGRTAGAMAEWLRERLERVGPDPSLVLLEIGPKIEAAVREAVGSSDARVPVYSLRVAGAVLARLEQARLAHGAGPIAVVASGRVRRHVHRLIAAQYPTAEVLARETLDPSLPRVPVDLPA